jgi:autotransporter-associated beta strand protein
MKKLLAPVSRAFLFAAAAAFMPAAQAEVAPIIQDGQNGTGYMLFEGSTSIGSADVSSIYTNFYTEGGAGSGGGAGLGGVFFVNSGASLTLTNVSFLSNTIKGGEGGSPPPVSLGGFTMAVIERTTAVTAVPDLAATPTILGSYAQKNYSVEKVVLNTVSPTYKAGFAAALDGTNGVSSIASIVGKEVTFAQPLQVASAAVFQAPLLTYSAAQSTILIDEAQTAGDAGKGLSDALFIGRIVVGEGIAPGTKITNMVLNAQGRVKEITLSKPTVVAGVGFDLLKVESFSAAQFKSLNNSSVEANATGLGLAVGMIITGDGVPEGTRVQSITPIQGSQNSVITFSQSVNNGANTLGFEARLPVLGDQNNVIRLSGGDPRLVAGMKITGEGIAPGTTITNVNLAAGTITLSQNVTAAPEEFQVSNVSSQSGNTLTMLNVSGLASGMLISGDNIPDGTTVTAVNGNVVTLSNAPTGEIIALTAMSPLNIGGSINNIAYNGSLGSNGRDGYHGRPGAAFLMEGEGQEGTNGYYAGSGTGAPGGRGGVGGNGSNGIPFNWALTWEVTSLSFDLGVTIAEAVAAATNVDEADPLLPHPDPDFGEMGVKIAAASIIAVDLGTAITNLTLWSIDMSRGLVARGGAGGDGGSGGDGDEFFGGGAGGAGGRGGEGGASWTDGGDGGSGGSGGAGGFGAGGGSGGAAGVAGSTGQGVDGDNGDGGSAGFGAGVGTSGDGTGGGGGSGFGGAIFIRAGGSVTLTGNGLFENNAALGGSSNNSGESGQAAGTDIFLMRGAQLYIAPGAGKTIRFEGTIADDSAASIDGGAPASGAGATVRFGGGGLVQLNGENTYTGLTQIEGATLAVDDGVGINRDSRIYFAGAGRLGSLSSGANTGTVLTSGTFVRRVGTLSHQLTWNGAGGFAAASEEGLVLNFGKLGGSIGQTLLWNSPGINNDSVFVFGSEYGQGSVHLINAVNMNTRTGKFAVYGSRPAQGTYAAEHTAYLAGFLSNGSIEVGSAGMDGLLLVTASNELTGATVNSGTVSVLGRLFKPGVGGDLRITNNGEGAGTVYLWNDELILNAIVSAGGELTAAGAITTTSIDNAGTINFGGVTTTNSVLNRAGGEIKVLGGMQVAGSVNNQSGASFIQSSDITVGSGVLNEGQWTVIGTPTDGTRSLTVSTGLTGNGLITLARSVYANGNSPSITVDAELTLSVGNGANAVFAGQIAGAGSLVKSGLGTQTFSGANTFTGDLTVSQGSLLLTGTQSDLTDVIVASGALVDFGAADTVASVTVNAGASAYLDAAITTTGSYANNGLTVANASRTLTIGNGLVGSGTLSVPNAGTRLTVRQSGNTSYAGSVVGLCAFTKDGTGTLTLSGSAGSLDLAQGVVVNGGVLALAGAGILDADLDLIINANGTLRLVSGDQNARSLAGTGIIDLGVSNRLTVANGGEFFGSVIGSGVLDIGGGAFTVSNSITSTQGTFNVAPGASTTISNGAELEFPDINVETGSLLDVVGTVTSETTTVETGGTLHLGNGNGSQRGSVVSDRTDVHGTLSGVGSLTGDVNVLSGANLRPGNSPGILSFVNLTLGNLSVTQLEIDGTAGAGVNPNGHDQIQVSGSLAIDPGASVQIVNSTAFELSLGQQFKVLSFADGAISGHFSTAARSGFANEVILNLATGNVVGMGPAGHSAFVASLAPDLNQQRMLADLMVEDNGGVQQYYGGKLVERLAATAAVGGDTDRVFSLASPERHVALLDNVRSSLFATMMNLPSEAREGWNYRYTNRNQSSIVDGSYSEYRLSSNGASVDYTRKLASSYVSATVGYDDGRATGTGYRAESNGVNLGVSWSLPVAAVKGLTVGVQTGMSSFTNDVLRDTSTTTAAASNVDSKSSAFGFSVDYVRPIDGLNLALGLDVIAYQTEVEAFTENNPGNLLDSLDVHEQKNSGTAFVATVGLSGKYSEQLTLGADLRLTAFGSDREHMVSANVAPESTVFAVGHEGVGRTIFGMGFSAEYQLSEASSLGLSLRFEGDGSMGDGFRGDLNYRRRF